MNKDKIIGPLPGFNDWANVAVTLSMPGGGVRPVTTPRPDEELKVSQLLNIYAGLKVFALKVTRQPAGNLVSWARVPLESVVGYEVLRTAPGQRPVVIRQTSKSQFIDTGASPRIDYSYQVRTVVSGFAAEAIQRATTSISDISSLATEQIGRVLSVRRDLGQMLMLSQPSQPVKAAK